MRSPRTTMPPVASSSFAVKTAEGRLIQVAGS